MKNIIAKIKKSIGTDGLLHFFVCFGLTALLANFSNLGLAFMLPVVLGFLKEIVWDAKLKKGTFQWKDLLCDIAGSLVAFLIVLFYLLITKQPIL